MGELKKKCKELQIQIGILNQKRIIPYQIQNKKRKEKLK